MPISHRRQTESPHRLPRLDHRAEEVLSTVHALPPLPPAFLVSAIGYVAGPTGFLVRCDRSLPRLIRLGLALVHELGGGLRRNDKRVRLRELEQL